MAATKALVPNFMWAQDKKTVFLQINLTDVVEKEMKVDVKKEGMEFTGTAKGKEYHLSIKFRNSVNPSNVRYSVKRLISFLLEKEDSSIWWAHLLAEDDKKKIQNCLFN